MSIFNKRESKLTKNMLEAIFFIPFPLIQPVMFLCLGSPLRVMRALDLAENSGGGEGGAGATGVASATVVHAYKL